MKFELDLDDATVEALVKLKSKMVLTNETLESVAVSALKQGLGLEPFETDNDDDDQVDDGEPSIVDMLRAMGGGPHSGMVGVKVSSDGKMEILGGAGDDLPPELKEALTAITGGGGLLNMLKDAVGDGDNCPCSNCVARRNAEKPKNFS